MSDTTAEEDPGPVDRARRAWSVLWRLAVIAAFGGLSAFLAARAPTTFDCPAGAMILTVLAVGLLSGPDLVALLRQSFTLDPESPHRSRRQWPFTAVGMALVGLAIWQGASVLWLIAASSTAVPIVVLTTLIRAIMLSRSTLKVVLRVTPALPTWAYHPISEGVLLSAAWVGWLGAGWAIIKWLVSPASEEMTAAVASGTLAAIIWTLLFATPLVRVELTRLFEEYAFHKFGQSDASKQFARDALRLITERTGSGIRPT